MVDGARPRDPGNVEMIDPVSPPTDVHINLTRTLMEAPTPEMLARPEIARRLIHIAVERWHPHIYRRMLARRIGHSYRKRYGWTSWALLTAAGDFQPLAHAIAGRLIDWWWHDPHSRGPLLLRTQRLWATDKV